MKDGWWLVSHSAKILIVDDDQGMRGTLSEILEEEGYILESASSGKEATDRISKEFHNVALIDIRLPDISGIELLERIKQISPDTVVMLITGYASIETSVKALDLGAEAYIIKPLDIDKVKGSIHNALEKQKLLIENRRLVEELQESNELLREEIRKKEALQVKLIQSEKLSGLNELAAGISHEINNPLCAILGRSQLLLDVLKKSSGDPGIENGLHVIESEGKRIARIVENLDLYCRRSESGLQMLDINRIIENTLSLIEAESETLHVKVHKEFDPSLPMVRGNESRLMRVFMSLMRNARAAMPEGGVISIRTSDDRQDGAVSVVLRDTGDGIPEENLRKIFDPFFTTKDPGKGIGLGLSIAYQIIKEHGGDISIESKEGEGTTVSISLPTDKNRAVAQAGQSVKKEEER